MSLETYTRLGVALGLRPEVALVDSRRSRVVIPRAEDPVHAAMGELEAAHLRTLGVQVAMDEPYQHYQFAGRADVLGWRQDPPALLHIENRTAFPNVQDAAGSFTAKRAYLAPVFAARLGIPRWSSVTHVMAVLWSTDAIRSVRLRRATFGSLCPDAGEAFEGWWNAEPPATGSTSTLIFLDAAVEGTRRSTFRGLDALDVIKPRYRGYADALSALRALGRV